MRSRFRELLPGQAASNRIQVQSVILRQFNRAAHTLAGERRHHNSALLYIQDNGASGW